MRLAQIKKPVAWKYFGSPDQVTGGLGTGVFGPNVSANRFSVPLVMTQGASEVGLYIASSGKQSAMLDSSLLMKETLQKVMEKHNIQLER